MTTLTRKAFLGVMLVGRRLLAAVRPKRWGMVIDIPKCLEKAGCTKCMEACHSVHNAFRAVVQGLAEGRLTTGQAEHMTNVLEFGRKSIETHEVARRLAELENQLKQIKELKVT